MTRRLRRVVWFAVAMAVPVSTVLAQNPIHPGKTGAELRALLVADYKTSTVLTAQQAQDTLFAVIDNGGGSVTCVYTGFTVVFDGLPSADPSQDILNPPDQATLGLNNEHTWPQALGAGSGNAHTDMHHWYPSKVDVNFDRASLPFGEIEDVDVDWWYFDSMKSSAPIGDPAMNSKLETGVMFEPRDDHKGNVARAMFYFYTMYSAQADTAFFDQQKVMLWGWHLADPSDAAEVARSERVAAYQDSKINPFVVDATLVERAFFSDTLPIELVRFEAVLNDGRVALWWETASESNNSGFEVQQRQVIDGIFRRVAFVPAATTGELGSTYSYTARVGQSGQHEFRLRQIDSDGGWRYSSTISVAVPSEATGITGVWSNPAGRELHVSLISRATGAVQLAIFDHLGRPAKVIHISTVPGEAEFAIDVSDLASGLYLLHVSGPRVHDTRPIVVRR